jgi:uncharacterized integral membrane protein
MTLFLRLLRWLVKAAIFFTLFAFALNNQQEITVNFFFGRAWQSPTVLVVLGAFALGVTVGVLGMAPWWWRQKRAPAPHPLPASSPRAEPVYADGI